MKPSFNKPYLVISFASNVPEFTGQSFATEKEAHDYAMQDRNETFTNRPIYVYELKGIVDVTYNQNYT